MATDQHRIREQLVQQVLLDEPDFLKEIIERVLQQLLEAEITEHIGVAPYERSESRTGQRNGYKPRTLRSRVGTLNLLVPQDRELLHLSVRPLPEKREGAGPGAHGDVRRGCLDPQGRRGH